MTSATTKFQLGAAALAMAAAAAVSPVVAQADSVAPMAPSLTSFAKGLGSSAGTELCDPASGGVDCAALSVVSSKTADATGANSLFQNDVIWLGAPNPNFWNDPNTVDVWSFSVVNVLPPGVQDGPIGEFLKNQSSQSCFIGITTTFGGPYAEPGQFKHSYNRSGCNVGWNV